MIRGFVVSLLFAVGWLALVFTSRPHVAGVAPTPSAIHAAIESVDTWSFTPALLTRGEWGWFADDGQLAIFKAHREQWLQETSARLDDIDQKIGERFLVSAALTLLGIGAFWAGIFTIARVKHAAGVLLIVAGPLLPCVVVQRFSGLLISGPPLAAGVLILLMTVVLRRFQPQR